MILNIMIFLVLFEFFVSIFLDFLNKKKFSTKLPEELKKFYDEKKYRKSMEYENEKQKFSLFSNIFMTSLILIFLVFGIFGKIYNLIFSFGFGEFFTNLIFFLVLFLGQSIVNLPFSYYYNFVLEKNFGFNKMTKKIFFTDFIKSLFLGMIIGLLILSIIMFFYFSFLQYFWILAWLVMVLFSIFSIFLYSSLIVPLFNKQTPLEDGTLKQKINDFALKVGFKLENIFVIDGSKRSTKANAYFSGFGSKKRIVLFDTLIKDLSDDELVAVLAHEIGHYKKKHVLQMLIFSVFQTGIIFFILGIILQNPDFTLALGTINHNFALGFLAFLIIFSPISMIFGIFGNILSRKNEYEADFYAKQNFSGEYLKNALIKLATNNLTNFKPHPFYEFFYYSHPTVLKRLKALEK